jgi:hypothetical protein
MVRTEEFTEEFRSRHGREPSAVERVNLRNAGAMAARIEWTRTTVEDQVRCSNALRRLLLQLGLGQAPASKPAVEASAHARTILAEMARADAQEATGAAERGEAT